MLCGDDDAAAGVDVRGSAPGTRETDLLSPVSVATGVAGIHSVRELSVGVGPP